MDLKNVNNFQKHKKIVKVLQMDFLTLQKFMKKIMINSVIFGHSEL